MNFEKAFKLCLILLLAPGMLLAVDGKIRGTVKDAETGQPLMGTNVVIQGTMMGSATDENGEFIILNIPVGKYSLVATYMGYQKVTVGNVIVSENQTTFQNYSMPKTILEGQEVVILAEKPLVNRGATNDIKVLRSETIENMPVRGYANIIGAQVGAVMSGTNVYVRGGRLDEVGYFVDGVSMNNPYDRTRTGDVSQNALEEISYQPGGMNAEYGMFNSGVVSTSTKTGGSKLAVSSEVISDQYLGYNDKKFGFGAYSYGYNLYNLAVSGSVPYTNERLRFYGIVEYNFRKDRTPSWAPSVEPSVFAPLIDNQIALDPQPVPLYGAKKQNPEVRWNGTGNLYWDNKNYKIKVGGNVTLRNFWDYRHIYAPFDYQNNPMVHANTYTGYVKGTWVISPQAFVEANANYYIYDYKYASGKYGDNFMDYGDPSKNLNTPTWGLAAPAIGDFANFGSYGMVRDVYNKEHDERLNFKLDGTWQINKIHELKAGASANLNVVRFYNVAPVTLSGSLHNLYQSDPNPTDAEIRNMYIASYADNAGYDYTGNNLVNSGRDDARRPQEYSFYVQDKMEFKDMVMNLGLHVDHIRVSQKQLSDPYNIVLDNNGEIAESNLLPAATYTEFSPRLGLSFPVTDRTVFHLQYGKYVQPAPYDLTYISWSVFAANLRNGNFTESANPSLKPVKTTSYEVGLEQQIGSNASVDVTAFYKEIRDEIKVANVLNALPTSYASYVNGDFGNVKGFSFSFQLRRTARILANANYTIQWANGTGSDPESQYRLVWQFTPNDRPPTYVAPLDYDQRHTASLNVDFRTQSEDGPELFGVYPLGEVGLNVWWTYGSGLAYTPETPISTVFASAGARFPVAAINSSHRPANSEVSLRLDKKIRFNSPIGTVDLTPYIWVINVFNTKQVITVYNATGLADDDGYLNTLEGQAWAKNNPTAAKWYGYRVANPDNFGDPRQIRLGLRIDFK
jgi:outer membrane receptor protein involved in Fe transport